MSRGSRCRGQHELTMPGPPPSVGVVRILIFGGHGYLGGEVARQAGRAGQEICATCFSRGGEDPAVQWHRVDVRHQADVEAVVSAVQPDVVVNAAFQHDDWMTTADGAANVALAAVRHGARLVHLSSDAVFSGAAPLYDECAAPDPIKAYGAAKAAAETAIGARTRARPSCGRL